MKSENKVRTRFDIVRLGAIIGLVSPFVWILLVVVMGFFYTDYSHLTNYISDLGALDAPHPYFQRLNFFQFGLAQIFLAVALFKGMEKPSITVFVFQIIIGLGIFLSGIFSGHALDHESHASMLHGLVGMPAFLLIMVVPFVTSWKFRKRNEWQDLAPYSMVLTLVLVTMFILMAYADMNISTGGTPGLFQRLFLGCWMFWMVMISLRLYRLQAKRVSEIGL